MLNNASVYPTLPATDIERAKKFYTEKLGLKVSESQEEGGVTFECGNGTKIFMYQRPPVKVEHTLVSFDVNDLEVEMKELRGKGVVFEEYDMPNLKTENGIATMGNVKGAWFKDTEGNILSIGQKI